VQRVVDRHRLDQRGVEEVAELRHQAAPLVALRVVPEEAVQRGVEGVRHLHPGAQRVDHAPTGRGLRVEDGGGQRADGEPRLDQRVVILHLHAEQRGSLKGFVVL